MTLQRGSRVPAVLVFLVFLLASAACASAKPPASATSPTAADLPAGHGDVVRAKLPNGLRVVILRNALAATVTTQITYLAGGYDAPQGFPGTAHALEHMMFRGSRGLSEPQLDEIVGKMGADSNAFTRSDATQFYFSAPAQYLDVLLRIESLRMRDATLTEKNWRLERGAIEQEVSMRISNPQTLAYFRAQQLLYAGTGYAHDSLGTRPSFDKTTSATLRAFYDRWYQPNNAVLIIAGDVDPHATLAEVTRLFGPIRRGKVPARAPVDLQPLRTRTLARITPEATGKVQFFYRMPGLRSPDHAAMQVLLAVLNDPRSRLSQLVVQGGALSAGASIQPFEYGGIGVIQAGFAKDDSARNAQASLQHVIHALLEHGVPANLVAAAKRKQRTRFEFAKDSAFSEAKAWSWALAWQGLKSPLEALHRIEQVTPAEVDHVARKYLLNGQRIIVLLTPGQHGKPPPHGTGFGGTARLAGHETLTVALPAWAKQALSTLTLPRWTLHPTQVKLANGITLIVQPETVSKTVTVAGHIDHADGLQEPTGQEGVGKLLGELFANGTAKLGRKAFHTALAEIGATESAGPDFGIAVPSADFMRGMQLLAENELHPALTRQAFEVRRKMLVGTLAGKLQSPDYRARRALDEGLLPAGDPGLRQATPRTVKLLTLPDVKHYFRQVYRPDMATIVVVGSVTVAQAKAVVEKCFGAWTARGPSPDVIPRPVPLNPARRVWVKNAFASQDQVTLAQVLELDIHNPARYALQLGNEVLGANGGASRLMVDIRVNHGYAYYADSSMDFDRSRASFLAEYGTDPGKVSAAEKLVRQNIETMRAVPVTAGELANARQALIRSIPLQVSSVDDIAHALLDWSEMGEPLDAPMVAARHYLRLTPRQVQAAFKQYLRPAHLVQVIQGPKPENVEELGHVGH